MPVTLSFRLGRITESATLKLNALVQEMKAKGEDVINLTAGEPDFRVHDIPNQAVIEAVKKGKSKYPPVGGLPDLRKAIADKTNSQQSKLKTAWESNNVIVTNGGKHALFNALFALLDSGDEVIIPAPYWVSYPDMVKIADGVPKIVFTDAESQFKLNPDQLRKSITSKTKALILNSPSNPTGSIYTDEEFKALGKVVTERGPFWVISDEIYDRINFGEVPFTSFLGAVPELQETTLTINGMSKSAAMTGWRIGWAVGPAPLIKGMQKLQGQSTSGVNVLAQEASIAAFKVPEADYKMQADTFRIRRDLVLKFMQSNEKISVNVPQGAFYMFIDVSKFFKKGEDSIGFSERLLTHAKVAVVPGTPFGEKNFVRLSFATDERSLREGCERFLSFTKGLSVS